MSWYRKYAESHPVTEVIFAGGNKNLNYLYRWALIPKNPFINIFLHHFVGDDRRTLHDHPWISLAYGLEGEMYESYRKTPESKMWFRITEPGKWYYRRSIFRHYLELAYRSKEAWTIFITGPKIRKWGFETNSGWESADKLFTREGIKRNSDQ